MNNPNSVIKLVENAIDEKYLEHINNSLYQLSYKKNIYSIIITYIFSNDFVYACIVSHNFV